MQHDSIDHFIFCEFSSPGLSRLYLIHEFTSFFSTKVIFVGMPKKTFPRKQVFVDRKQGPRFSQGPAPKGYYQMKELDRTTEPIARMTVV